MTTQPTTDYVPAVGEEIVISGHSDRCDDYSCYCGFRAQVLEFDIWGRIHVRIADPLIPVRNGEELWVTEVKPADAAYWREQTEKAHAYMDLTRAERDAAEERLRQAQAVVRCLARSGRLSRGIASRLVRFLKP